MAKKVSTNLALIKQAEQFSIQTQVDAEEAASVLQKIKDAKVKIEEMFGPQVKSTYTAWQTALEQKNNFMKPLNAAEKALKSKMSDFTIMMEKLAEEQKAKMDECNSDSFCPAPYVEGPKEISGLSSSSDIEVNIIDLKKLLAAVIKGAIAINIDLLVDVKLGVVKQFVRTTGIRKIPGVTIKDKKIIKVK